MSGDVWENWRQFPGGEVYKCKVLVIGTRKAKRNPCDWIVRRKS